MLSLPVTTTALVLIDLQKGILANPLAPHPADQVVARAKSLVDAFRSAGAPVVLVHVYFGRDAGLRPAGLVDQPMAGHTPPPPEWAEFHPALEKDPRDIIILKRHWGAFHGTELDLQLRRRGVTTIVLGGVATNFGVEQTAREAWQHNYSVVIAEDACAAPAVELHTFAIGKILPRIARVRSTAEVLGGLGKA